MVISSQNDALAREVERSRSILDLGDDWDGEGSVGYLEETWLRAVEFLRCGAQALVESLRIELPPPRIAPGPEGGIDLHWEWTGRELLVSVPAESAENLTFYGDDGSGNEAIRGEVSPCNRNLWLMVWLTS